MTSTPAPLIGPAGEALVRFDLLRRGVSCHESSAGSSFDLIAEVRGRLLRVEVKTTQSVYTKDKGKRVPNQVRKFNLGGKVGAADKYDNVDVFAFVALDLQTVLYYWRFDLTPSAVVKSIGHTQFNAAEADASFARCFGAPA